MDQDFLHRRTPRVIPRTGRLLSALAFILFLSCGRTRADPETVLLYTRATGLYSGGRFSEAADLLAAVKSFPPALVLRGKALYFSDRTGEAENVLRRALRIRPSSAEASLYLARILRDRGDQAGAGEAAESLIADNPSDLRALRLAAEIALRRGPAGISQASSYLDRAVEAGSELSLVLLDRARLRWTGGNGPGALEDLRTARMLLPENSPLSRSILALEKTILEALK